MTEAEENKYMLLKTVGTFMTFQFPPFLEKSYHCTAKVNWDPKRWHSTQGHMPGKLYKPFTGLGFWRDLPRLPFFPLCWNIHLSTCLASFGLSGYLYYLASCKWLILKQCLRTHSPRADCLVWILTAPLTRSRCIILVG